MDLKGLTMDVSLHTLRDSASPQGLCMEYTLYREKKCTGISLNCEKADRPEKIAREIKQRIEQMILPETVEAILFHNGIRNEGNVTHKLPEDDYQNITHLLQTFPPQFHYSPKVLKDIY